MSEPRSRILDDLLVLRCQEGSAEAFRLLVQKLQPALWRHAYRLTGREDVAWDVLQETWIAVTRGIGKLQEPHALRGWAYTIVSRKAADWQRRRPVDEAGASIPDEQLEAPDAASEGATEDLAEALRRLPGDRRALLNLHYVEGFGIAEIADILGIPAGTVKSRLHTARGHLQDIIERTNHE